MVRILLLDAMYYCGGEVITPLPNRVAQKEMMMQPAQPKRRRLVDHPAFPFIFWTVMILFVLGGVAYLLAPTYLSQVGQPQPCQHQVTQTFAGQPITAQDEQGHDAHVQPGALALLTIIADYTETVDAHISAPCGPSQASAIVTCNTSPGVNACHNFVFMVRYYLLPYHYGESATAPIAPIQRSVGNLTNDQTVILTMPWTTTATCQFQIQATVDGWLHTATIAACDPNPLP